MMEESMPRTLDELESRILLLRSEIRTARPANVATVCSIVQERMATQVRLAQLNRTDLIYVKKCVDKLQGNVEEIQRCLAVQRYARKYKLPLDLAYHNVDFLHNVKKFEWYQIP